MISKLHDRLGTAGFVIAVVALIAALAGTAWAAAGLNSKQKKEVTKIAKKYAGQQGPTGPAGAQGPAGPAGPAGPKGDAGAAGTNGTNGTNGKSAVVTPSAPSCTEGGITVEVQGSGEENELCNGEKGATGSPWTAGGTLPAKATETGSWATTFNTEGATPITFSIPLAAELASTNVIVVPAAGPVPANCENSEHAGTASANNPEAKSGFLCVYTGFTEGGASIGGIYKAGELQEGASVSGAALILSAAAGATAIGTWAVTG